MRNIKKLICCLLICILVFTTISLFLGTVIASDPPVFRNQGQSKSVVGRGDGIELYAQGQDDIALDWAWLATNETGEWKEYAEYQDWSYSKEIRIDHTLVAADLTNFPVLISHTSPDFIAHAQDDGDDFKFVDITNTTQYSHEIDYYDSATGTLVAWVSIPFLSSTEDTIFYLYYGNPDCGNQENVDDTWNSGYRLVHHMDGTTYGELDDSTSNGFDVTSAGGNPSYSQDGKVGTCVDFDGSGDYFKITGFTLPEDSPHTGSCWVYVTDTYHNRHTFFCGDYDDGPAICLTEWTNGTIKNYAKTQDVWNILYSDTKVSLGTPEWIYVATVVDTVTDEMKLFINGIKEKDRFMDSSLLTPEPVGLNIGAYKTESIEMEGKIDEIRISDIPRNDAWIQTEYNSMVSPSTFLTVGSEQSSSISGRSYGSPLKMQENSQWQWSNFTWQNPSIPEGTVVGWRIYYNDTDENVKVTDVMSFTIQDQNLPPSTPEQPGGPSSGSVGEEYEFNTDPVVDPDDDDVAYWFDWGDGTQSGWTDFAASGSGASLSYIWQTEGTFEVKVKAKDIHGAESDWSPVLPITITEIISLPQLTIDAPSSVVESTDFYVIITSDSAPVENAVVEFAEETFQTDGEGSASLTAPSVNQNTKYTITVSHDDYVSVSSIITVLIEPTIDNSWIYGRVTNASGGNIERATICVLISDTGTTSKCIFTDKQGLYNILVTAKTHTIEASKQGYKTSTKSGITVHTDEAVEVNFILETLDNETIPPDENQILINEAIESGNIGGEITFQQEENEIRHDETRYANITITPLNINKADNTISLLVGGEETGKTIVITIYESVFSLEDVLVEYDGVKIKETDNLLDVLNAHDDGSHIEYYMIEGTDRTVVLVSIPHFSDHIITISSFVEVVGSIAALVSFIIVSVIAAMIFAVPVYLLYFRKVKE